MNAERQFEHRKPSDLEERLRYFAGLLGPLEQDEIAKLPLCDEPILYIMGCARSGTTLVYQYLSQSGLFTFPTNFVSRFYYAPYLGARLQEMLYQMDFRDEITGVQNSEPFSSTLGKTRGPLSPHEFWYFWRRFFSFRETQKLESEILARTDGELFLRELRAFQTVDAKALVLKGAILNWDIPYLAGLYPRGYFLYIYRDVKGNANSLVRARQEFFGDVHQWYSFKPPEYKTVVGLDPISQAVWQVLETNAAIEDGLTMLPDSRVFRISYESFCLDPLALLQEIGQRWSVEIPNRSRFLPASFSPRHSVEEKAKYDWTSIFREVSDLAVRHVRSIPTKYRDVSS